MKTSVLIDPVQVGIYSIIISFLSIIINSGQFDGIFLCIAGKIKVEKLRLWHCSSNTIIFISYIILFLIIYFQERYITLLLTSFYMLGVYTLWEVDLKTIKGRLNKDNDKDIIFKNERLKQTLIFKILISLLVLFTLLYFKNFILIESFLFASYVGWIALFKIKICRNFIKEVPNKEYILPVFLKKIDNSCFPWILGSLLGLEVLGSLQPLISLGKTVNMITPTLLTVEFKKLYSKKTKNFLKKINFLLYFLYVLIPIMLNFGFKYFGINDFQYELIPAIIIFLYFGAQNTKSLLISLYNSLGLIASISKLKSLLIFSKVFLLGIGYCINQYQPLGIIFSLSFVTLPDLILINFYYTKFNKKGLKTIKI